MERREFMKTAAVAGVGAAAATASTLATPAIAQGVMEWRMVTAWPKGLPGVYSSAERVAKRIEDASGGRLKIKVFGAGEIVPGLQVFDAVSNGTAELGHDTPYYHTSKSKATAFFTTVPFGMTQVEHNAWINMAGGQALWEELYAPFNLQPFMCGNTGVQMGGWFRKEIQAPEDFKGLKFRMPGMGAEVLKKLGANVVLLPGGEVFAALQSGAIDGTEWTGPYNDLSMGFYKVAPNYYWPGIHEPSAAMQLIINKEKFAALPKDLQAIIAAAAGEENMMGGSEFFERSGTALETLVRDHGVKLRQFPRSVLVALGNAAGEVLQETLDNGDAITKKVATHFLKTRTNLIRWTRIADQGFANARQLEFKYPTGE
ncbi:TRAP transporter substrate-binding protein [Insolitispirillum peregrinum]|uniref:Tat (Twin-arginine translocation) pathway signal sequence n=1 Tax=Insolitispirillum peregrinum TaxID=80876 RepID=A0A1N7INB1_9PROT|nr:TRAP transporter substrate-binding protein [Insolitispirillum peregrinum]SIS38559.1 Tat (twin-arginine translocation) pathway signal sequence [Insolitispirillum peregrinum]